MTDRPDFGPGGRPGDGLLNAGEHVAERYHVESLLGSGASGAVYVARCIAEKSTTTGPTDSAGTKAPSKVAVGDRVALKVIHRHLVRDYQIFKRFAREARILRKLTGPQLVPVLDFGETGEGQLFMALELVEGPALDQRLSQGSVPPQEAVRITGEICAALEVAHRAGVVHRDLKPGNVLLDETAGHARVLDFGMAKMLQGASTSLTALTESNMVFGTPEYMAPEMARGEDVDERSDVYAAGIILYEMLTGRVPFQGNTPIATMTAHLLQEAPPPSSRSSAEIPPAVEAIVMHAMAKDPANRYPSARALREALEAAARDPVDIRSITPPPSLAHADTDHAMDRVPPGPRGEPPRVDAMEKPSAPAFDRTWVIVAVIAALVGIGTGIVMSLRG